MNSSAGTWTPDLIHAVASQAQISGLPERCVQILWIWMTRSSGAITRSWSLITRLSGVMSRSMDLDVTLFGRVHAPFERVITHFAPRRGGLREG